ncbi:FAD:protein FMN transferase [Escherichia coli]
MKAKTGLQHLTVINQSHQQYLQKDLPDLNVDLSTVGEGYAADHLARLMEQEGISRYLVSVGGALNSRGMNGEGQPWRVAIQNQPIKKTRFRLWWISTVMGLAPLAATVTITNWTANVFPMSSIRKPGCPIEHNLVSVTVIAPTRAGSRCLGYWLDGTRAGESQRGCSPGRAGGLYDHQRRR